MRANSCTPKTIHIYPFFVSTEFDTTYTWEQCVHQEPVLLPLQCSSSEHWSPSLLVVQHSSSIDRAVFCSSYCPLIIGIPHPSWLFIGVESLVLSLFLWGLRVLLVRES
jgi:hypothetical protein